VSKVPSLSYSKIIAALKRDGWSVIRQKGSHIRLEKSFNGETLRITVPAHRPVKRSTLSHIIKQARLTVDDFLKLL
jgi:predicted RNA binding protein YcfA (HicA-like mRNA interferase family)